jgi:hypothetical protein
LGKENKPDLFVVDLISTFGQCVAEILGVPFVMFSPLPLAITAHWMEEITPSYIPYEDMWVQQSQLELKSAWGVVKAWVLKRTLGYVSNFHLTWRRNEIRAKFGLPPLSLWTVHGPSKPVLTIIASVFGLDYPRPLPPFVHLVGK